MIEVDVQYRAVLWAGTVCTNDSEEYTLCSVLFYDTASTRSM